MKTPIRGNETALNIHQSQGNTKCQSESVQ